MANINPMQAELTAFVEQYGFSGVLEILEEIAIQKSLAQFTRDEKLESRLFRLAKHLKWLYEAKFVQNL